MKIQKTTDYSKFRFSLENRDVQLSKPSSRNLRDSMNRYGWLDAFPMMCKQNGKALVIVDGQHRFSIAKEIGLPVKYVIDNTDVDVSRINESQRSWNLHDYMNRWQKDGRTEYNSVQEFMDEYGLPIGMAINMLYGNTVTQGHAMKEFRRGNFRVRNRVRAEKIARAYNKVIGANNSAKNSRFLAALQMCFNVADFDPDRFVDSCQKYPHMIQPYGRTSDYLDMIEEIYNHAKKRGRIPIKFLAQEKSA